MRAAEWVGLIAGLTAILGAFVAALRWTVHQFVLELSHQFTTRMDRIETDISVLSSRQSDIYAKLMHERGGRGSKEDKGAKARKPTRKRASR